MAERSGELNREIEIINEKEGDAAVITAAEKIRLKDRPVEIGSDVVVKNEVTASDDPDQIRENIEETRAEMSETIDAIQEKLSFSNISEQVKTEVADYVGETFQTTKDAVIKTAIEKGEFIMRYADKRMSEIANTEVVKTAKRNPWALGLIGLGLGMLFLGGSNKKKRSKFRYDNSYGGGDRDYRRDFSSKNQQSTIETAQNKLSGSANAVGDSISSAAGTVSDTVSSAVGTVSNKVSNAAGAVSGTVSSAAGAISETAGDVANMAYKQAGNIGAKAQDYAGAAQDNYEYYMEENPLAVGAVALALGAAVGMVFPSTKIENRYMGEARNNLLHKAEETARDAVGKVQKVAGEVTETVKEEAKKVAGQVTETVKEEAKNQGLT